MENNVVYVESGNRILLLTEKCKRNGEIKTIPINSFNQVDDIINNVKTFTTKEVNKMKAENPTIKATPLFNFVRFILNHKCKCSDNCVKFINGGMYNIPNVGGISLECYDRISNNGQLSPYKVMLALQNKK